MKSRKSAKVSQKSKRADLHRRSLRGALRTFETLEDRKLLTATPWTDGAYYPFSGAYTGRFTPGMDYSTYMDRALATNSPTSGGLTGEGAPGPAFTGVDTEPNSTLAQAQFVPLSTLDGRPDRATVIGSTSAIDFDVYAMDLRAGDVFDVELLANGGTWDLSLRDAANNEVAGSTIPQSPAGAASPYPASSPLAFGGRVSFSINIPTTGRYYMRVSDGPGNYSMTMRAFRPYLESQPVGTKQILYLDFNGEDIPRRTFVPALTGTARLSSLSTFLAGWNLSPADENRVIDSIIENVAYRFTGTIPTTGTNGHYSRTGTPGQFDLQILNSRDHGDVWGQPNVSRVIVGGTQLQLGLTGLYGIAQSVDIGNFETAETAVVLLDTLSAPGVPTPGPAASLNQIPIGGTKTKIDLIGEVVGNIVAHEAGHYFGNWHQVNAPYLTMSTGLGVEQDAAVGPDGVFGTADDGPRVVFGKGTYDATAGNIPFGIEDTASNISWALATGTVGGATIRGSVYQDTNLNRIRDNGDLPLQFVTIYNDANNNAILDANELSTFTDASGNYQMTVAPGLYILREYAPAGQKLVVPANLAHVISIANGQTITGKDFINERINPAITGMKWEDTNGNGIRDTGEPGIGGVFIYIDLDGDDRIDIGEPTTQTNADGTYRLNFPGTPGTYAVREVVAPGFTQTFPGPALGNEHTVVITGNAAIDAPRMSGLHFGNRLTVDFGDAPQTYGIASAGFLSGLALGSLWDAESSSQFSTTGLGDDSSGIDDEDAIAGNSVFPLRIGSSSNPVSITTTNTTGQTAYLQAWIDFNGDGDFNDTVGGISEQIVSNLAVTTAALPVFNVTVPAAATLGPTFARLRLSTLQNVGPTGQTVDGEVEDYAILIRPNVIAVDDPGPGQGAITIPRNAVQAPIDVLANDFRVGNEVLKVINVSQPTSGGLVTFTDAGVLYTPPSGYIGPDSFTYQMQNGAGEVSTATVTVNVALFFANPVAVDDSFDVPTNSIDFPLNVLANDIEGQNGALSIVSVTQPDKGGSISIATGNKSLRYTPSRDFGGTEFFTYIVSDAAGNQSTAKGTIHTLPGDRSNDKIEIRLQATDLAGNPISRIQQGQRFRIDMIVDDLRFDVNNPSPTLDAGVFAAYTDLLYNLQLVGTVLPNSGTPSGFNFATSFFNGYENGQTGDATIPGLINEFGAFFNGSSMNRVGQVRLASVIFEARTPGIARFLADPADAQPASDSLLFDTAANAVPIDQISYIGTSLEIVGDGVVFPTAVDDSPTATIPVATATTPVAFAIDVLANDLPGSNGPITLKSGGVSGAQHGTTTIANGRVVYTPNLNFEGSDQFTYTIVDSRGTESTARVTVRVGNNTANDDIIDLKLQVTDTNGNSIDQVSVGSTFQLRGFVKDLRTRDASAANPSRRGIFAAYQDVIYSSGLASTVASTTNDPNLGFQVSFGPSYQRVREGDVLTRGIINEIGAVATLDTPTNTDEYLLFVVTLTANSIGTANFVGDPADISPFHDSLTYEPVMVVDFSKIRYGFDSVQIVSSTGSGEGEFTNSNNPLDVNADGFVSPIDALAIINALNSGGSRQLTGGGGEGEGGSHMFVDTNADGYLSPIDVLNVINYLNMGSSGQGEGEGLQGEGEANDSGFYSDDLFNDGVDDLIATLAPDVEQSWKKRNK